MRALICLLLLFTLAGAAAAAHGTGQLVTVSVVDRDNGQTLPLTWHGGQAYVAGTPGHRYAVVLKNRTGARVLAVLSVDGVNAVSGETAAADQAGYVLGPWQQTEVTGWRKSLDDVAAFEFTALGDSYAARTGRPANVGVIGVAVFQERAPAWRHEDEIAQAPRAQRRRHEGAAAGAAEADAAPAPAAPMAESSADALRKSAPLAQRSAPLGTGHGAREHSSVRRTQFERASTHPAEVVAIRYDSEENLVAAGVLPRRWPWIAHRQPQPFPGGFAPDPR